MLAVSLIHPQAQALTDSLDVSGHVQPWQEIKISPEISGMTVKEVRAEVGARVSKGQVLAVLDVEKERLSLQQLDAQLESDRIAMKQAYSDWERMRKAAASLAEPSEVVSAQDLQKLETAYLASKSKVKASEAGVAAQALRLRQATLVAPDEGIVSARTVTPGQLVSVGAEFFRLIRKNQFEWNVDVPAEKLPLVSSGMPASLTLPGGTVVKGTVSRVSPLVTTGSDTGVAYVTLEPNATLKAGLLARGTLTLGNKKGILVPATAVVPADGRYYVVKVSADQVATRTPVDVQLRDDGQYEVLKGLSVEDSIVESGAAFLDTGDRVTVAQKDRR